MVVDDYPEAITKTLQALEDVWLLAFVHERVQAEARIMLNLLERLQDQPASFKTQPLIVLLEWGHVVVEVLFCWRPTRWEDPFVVLETICVGL